MLNSFHYRPHGQVNQSIQVKRYDVVKSDITPPKRLDPGGGENDLIGACDRLMRTIRSRALRAKR